MSNNIDGLERGSRGHATEAGILLLRIRACTGFQAARIKRTYSRKRQSSSAFREPQAWKYWKTNDGTLVQHDALSGK